MGVNMKLDVNGLEINYIDYGNKKGKPVVLLHGWGQNIEMMKPIGDKLEKDNRIIILDFPGFGNSPEPKKEMSVYEYCDVLEELLNKLKVKNPILIGHSFGGRIAIIYASRNKIEKLVLFGSPFRKEIEKVSFKVKVLKFMKKVPVIKNLEGFAKKHIGSQDYKSASDIMRKTLVLTVNQDLIEEAKKIDAPTLLIWGVNDQAVPITEAEELEKLIKDSALIKLPGTHYAYLENLNQVINILFNFI